MSAPQLVPLVSQKAAFSNGRTEKSGTFTWSASSLSAPKDPRESGGILDGLEAKKRLLEQMGHRTRVGLARSAMKASEHAADLDGRELMERDTSIALLNHAKVASVTHGWQPDTALNVNVANLVMPSEAEREERAQLHAAMDAIAAQLKSSE